MKLVTYHFIDFGSASFNNNILTILWNVGGQNKSSALKLEVTPFNSKKAYRISNLESTYLLR